MGCLKINVPRIKGGHFWAQQVLFSAQDILYFHHQCPIVNKKFCPCLKRSLKSIRYTRDNPVPYPVTSSHFLFSLPGLI